MKKIYVLLPLLLACATVFAQSTSLWLVGSAGNQSNSGPYQVSWSIGEPVTDGGSAGGLMLTQGFQQVYLPPIAPVATSASSVINISFIAHWTPGPPDPTNPVDYYLLDVSTSPTFASGSFLSGFQNRNVGLNQAYLVTGTTAGTTYYYRVRAHSIYGIFSNYSNIITIVTIPPNIPTLSEWGLIILGFVLLGAGTLYIMRWNT